MCGYVTSQNNNDNNGCMGTVLMYGCLTYVWVPYSCTGTVLMYGYRTYVWVPYSCTGAVLMYGYRTHVWVSYSCLGIHVILIICRYNIKCALIAWGYPGVKVWGQ